MKMSAHGLELLKKWEGCKLTAYRDAGSKLTIGVGHLITEEEKKAGKFKGPISMDEALEILAADVGPAEYVVNDAVKVPLSQCQFDALVSFAFNCGCMAFRHSTLCDVLNKSEYDEVPAQLARWNKVGGKVCDGLITRRANEVNLWNGEI